MVHRDSYLLNDAYPEKFRKDIGRRVKAFGIDIVLEDAVEQGPGRVHGVKTRDGKNLPDADLIVSSSFARRPPVPS